MKKTSKKKDELLLVLNGHIDIVEKKNGRVKSRERLDDKIALQIVRNFVEDALHYALERYKAGELNVLSEDIDAHEACQKFLEIHPYLCVCGAGLTEPEECEYCRALDRAVKALAVVGYAPSWYNRNKAGLAKLTKENEDENVVEGAGDADVGEKGPLGAPGSIPNCS